ncbi:stage II sporulation protein D [Chengkuizengella axinellae]|uniref:Stage II sporulation protein D n=1 Tax=Chengkuizengella axinellae TaxID=3064388 RepID=A0ABT9IZ46_9BACL|nr:stage II sporulation protein D [Chengkuizengella sp. 2205SS18-9]MDP5274645.1 stage II sporulation protein D [Chengkuizengella sp. 2205SS18-9]
MNKHHFILWFALWASVLLVASFIIPVILVNEKEESPSISLMEDESKSGVIEETEPIYVPIYMTKDKKVEVIPLETYVKGVIAAEMPIEFELEALKAQAIAARTYIFRRMVEQDFSNVPAEGKGAYVTDTVSHQVYLSEEKLQQRWSGVIYEDNMDKINRAVNETKGLIATYDNHPINSTFFSTSNGYTENSEDYWSIELPYLRSVESPWDVEISPKYKNTIVLSTQDFFNKLNINPAQPASTGQTLIKVLEWSEGHRIKKIAFGDIVLTGREVRERLGLSSSQFEMDLQGNEIQITSYGYGHGVGMSQWGANGMAKEGRTAEEILLHYYQGIEVQKVNTTL